MYNRNKILIVVLIMSIIIIALVPRPVAGRYIVATWSYPDDFGNGIDGFVFQQNSSGSWVDVPNAHSSQFGTYKPWNETSSFSYNYTFLRIEVWCYLNATHLGISDPNDAYLYQRHNISVSLRGNTTFSQQNFTAGVCVDNGGGMYYSMHRVIINIELAVTIYEIEIYYEVINSIEEP